MFRRRPNPFTSAEGCFLSQSVWGVSVMVGWIGGAVIGSQIGGYEGGAAGSVAGIALLGFTPWRRGVLALIRKLNESDTSDSGMGNP